MILTLEVIGPRAQEVDDYRKVFRSMGGTIGRLPDNDWVIGDPYISGRHALVRYVSGKYFIEDTSTNGVYLNSHDFRLPRGQAHPLRNGDRLFFDAYEIAVTIEDALDREIRDPFMEGPFAGVDDPSSQENAAVDDLAVLDRIARPTATPTRRIRDYVETAALPASAHAPGESRPKEAVAQGGEGTLDELYAAAGVKGLPSDARTAQLVGAALRASLAGAMDALRATARIQDDLNLCAAVEHADNNPLKFSAAADDAIHTLFVERAPDTLEPLAAIDDAFRAVRDHQRATHLAMRIAFETLVARFDPARLQEQFDRQMKKGSLLGGSAKRRYWEHFSERYAAMTQDAESSFRELFAKEFATAYEEQLARLKALGR